MAEPSNTDEEDVFLYTTSAHEPEVDLRSWHPDEPLPVTQIAVEEEPVKEKPKIVLCAEQLSAVKRISNAPEDSVIILTGQAGSGKSTIINALLENEPLEYTVTATTARAALLVEGVTIDRLISLNRDKWSIRSPDRLAQSMERCGNTIIIDEGSMVGKNMGDVIDHVRRLFKKRIVLVGDWAQASPVKDGWILGSKLLRDGHEFIKLVENHRQESDKPFMDVLNSLRLGIVTPAMTEMMKSRIVGEPPPEDDVIRMYATNKTVFNYNRMRFFQHCADKKYGSVLLHADFKDERKKRPFEYEDQFMLKAIDGARFANNEPITIGCRVLMTLNHPGDEYVNGDTGTVTEILGRFGERLTDRLTESGSDLDATVGAITVKFDRHKHTTHVAPVAKTVHDPIWDKPEYTIRGFPLTLGYALTVHKSQGATVNRAWVDMESFTHFPDKKSLHGLAYVALSRTRTLDGLGLRSWVPNVVFCDHEIESLI